MTVLLDNVTANVEGAAVAKRGGPAVVIVRGDTYDSGTVNIQMASVNDTVAGPRFSTLTDGAFTTDGQVKIDYLPVGTLIRATLTGSSGSSVNMYAELLQ